ncbi:hypothetical protein H7I41_04340, partial [Mycobacterium manitobense]|nr:hypothetical protein [[Mycobacterium] manitobense]
MLIGVGAAVALVASIVTVTIALSDSGDDRSTATGSSAATTRNAAGNSGATATVQSCDVPSSFGSATVSLTQEGLAVDVPIQTDCDAAVSLSGAGVQVAVFDGARDVAAGVFNLDMRPVVVSGQTTQRFVFPAGMYWRTPEMVSSTLTAEITGA